MNSGKNIRSLLMPCIAFTLVMLQLVACGGTNTASQATTGSSTSYKTVTVQNCGSSLTFTKAPTRVITTGQNVTDILLKLGLEKSIVGIYYGALYQPEPEFDAAYKHLHNLGGNMMMTVPSKESVLSLHPDFFFSAYPAGDFVASKGMPTREDLKAVGAQVYGLSGDCSLTTRGHIDDIYSDILNIGRIFQVEARAQQVVHAMQDQVAHVQKLVSNRPAVPAAIILLLMGSMETASYRVVGTGFFNDVMHLAGGENMFRDQPHTYVSVSKEAFAVQKPQAYVLVHYNEVNAAQFSAKLYATFPDLPASQKQRSVVIEGNYWNEGIHLSETIEKMARALHPEVF